MIMDVDDAYELYDKIVENNQYGQAIGKSIGK